MARRPVRKITRAYKIAHPEMLIKKEIGKRIESGAPLVDIAAHVSRKFHIQNQIALKMVMTEFDSISKDWMGIDEPSAKMTGRQAL